MKFRELEYRWEWRLKSTPKALWPLVSNTDRFNRDTGVPAVQEIRQEGKDLVNARRQILFRRLGVMVGWEEEPFEWVNPRRFGVIRRYWKGPITEMRVSAQLFPAPEGGTRLEYHVRAMPRNLFGWFVIRLQIGVISARSFSRAFQEYDRSLERAAGFPVTEPPPRVSPLVRKRLEGLLRKLVDQGANPEQARRLEAWLLASADAELERIRPYALADAWGASRRDLLELCLRATRLGLLEMRWNLLCPLCRGSKAAYPSLQELEKHVHCEACCIDFDVNFDRLAEVTFRPHPAIRKIDARDYCVGGPQRTSHVVVQQLLQPGEKRTLSIPLEEGRYRLRAIHLRGGQALIARKEGKETVALRAQADGWADNEAVLSLQPTIRFENGTEKEQLFLLERMAWTDQAATAAEVIAFQTFRDLFATEVLRSGEQISVGSMTILFTDLRESTRMYREMGDAAAFARVVKHFRTLQRAIVEEGGAIIKTIGDAVMAAFAHPASGLRALLKAQRELAGAPRHYKPLGLKAGLHTGPCIAVTLNDRLDYFGSTVNIASRLEKYSEGGDVILSRAAFSDPEMAQVLKEYGGSLRIETFEAEIRGFDEPYELVRVHTKRDGAS
jgi:class 3 adenylate cyclase